MPTNKVNEIHLFIFPMTVRALVYRCNHYVDVYPQVLTSNLYDNITVSSFMRCAQIGRLVMRLTGSTSSRNSLTPTSGTSKLGVRVERDARPDGG